MTWVNCKLGTQPARIWVHGSDLKKLFIPGAFVRYREYKENRGRWSTAMVDTELRQNWELPVLVKM